MSDTRSLTRRAALAGIGAGGLSLAFASRMAANPPVANVETGSDSSGTGDSAAQVPVGVDLHSENTFAANNVAMADHPLTGLWLATVTMASHPDEKVVVPSVFSGDGTVLLMFPVAERGDAGVELRGMAVGTWEMLDYESGHFTAVQVLCNGDGVFTGSITIDGYPRVRPGGLSFEDNNENSAMTFRDSLNRVVHALHGAVASNMVGSRMSPGNSGFVDAVYDIPANPVTPR